MQNLLWELLGLSGVAMLGVGLWWLCPPVSLVVLGAMFLWAGVRGTTQDSKPVE